MGLEQAVEKGKSVSLLRKIQSWIFLAPHIFAFLLTSLL